LESLSAGLAGSRFLDLYAGSGAVGLEAASRGAGHVVLVEREPKAAQVIRTNIALLGISDVAVVMTPVERYLASAPQPFDVVFLDPPYAEPVDATLALLTEGGWLSSEAVVCVERASRDAATSWPDGIAALRSRRYGDTTLWYGRAS
jgi:16S rRNA (guanine(966)-N(2))-methyltransferase RsmD